MSDSITDRDRGVLLHLAAHFRDGAAAPLTRAQVGVQMGRGQQDVNDSLDRLSEAGYVKGRGVGAAAVAFVTGLTEAGRAEVAGP